MELYIATCISLLLLSLYGEFPPISIFYIETLHILYKSSSCHFMVSFGFVSNQKSFLPHLLSHGTLLYLHFGSYPLLHRNCICFSSPECECKMLEKHCVPLALVPSMRLSTGPQWSTCWRRRWLTQLALTDYWVREKGERSEQPEPNRSHFGEEC